MPEIRKDAVTGNYVIIAAERSKRPHDFTLAPDQKKGQSCVFCYGNEDKTPPEVLAVRPGGGRPDSPGWLVRAFPNKFPAVSPESVIITEGSKEDGVVSAVGIHEVLVDSPGHNDSLGRVSDEQAELVLLSLLKRFQTLSGDPRVKYIQVFKNFGAAGGASLEHTHWQMITVPVTPTVVEAEFAGVKRHFRKTGNCIYCQMAENEILKGERIVEATDEFVVLAPFASRFPYELWILPRNHKADFGRATPQEVKALGHVVRRTVRRFERAFNYPPYNIVLHTSPVQRGYEIFHWHMEILPRLSVTAGFEWGSGIFINPTSPETAAVTLRDTDPQILID